MRARSAGGVSDRTCWFNRISEMRPPLQSQLQSCGYIGQEASSKKSKYGIADALGLPSVEHDNVAMIDYKCAESR